VELVQENDRFEKWERFVEDKVNNQIRQESIRNRLWVIADKDDELDNLLIYFLWP
jgi:hypothetical protein